ncbi:cache domain-containing protein, partial [Arcobacter caeni]
LTFSNKLLYGVLTVLILTSIITTYLIYNKAFEATKTTSEKYMIELAHKNALEIKGDIEKSVVLIKTFSSTLETALKEDFIYSKPELVSLMSSVLEKNPYIVGVWLYLEPNTFYENNPSMAGRYSHDENGRFSPYVLKNNGSLDLMWQYPVLKANSWILEPMRTGKEFISEPYKFVVDGENVLNTTVSIPLFNNNEIVGVV